MYWVIYKENGKFRATRERYFYANISDERTIYNLDEFETLEEVIEYFTENMCVECDGTIVGIILDTSVLS